jgi:hypothetical protein
MNNQMQWLQLAHTNCPAGDLPPTITAWRDPYDGTFWFIDGGFPSAAWPFYDSPEDSAAHNCDALVDGPNATFGTAPDSWMNFSSFRAFFDSQSNLNIAGAGLQWGYQQYKLR